MCVTIHFSVHTVYQCPKDHHSLSLLPLFSWIGLLKSGVWLGESGSDVWSDKHSIKTGSPGPSQTPEMHYNALCFLWGVSEPF